ncbi:MAG: hypothetical protein JKY25_10305 [Robiginitomaculum sp.]|nr:hypothetical protein [Robiginitomaculum sp.]
MLTQDSPSTFALKNQQCSATSTWETSIGRLKSISSYQSLEKWQASDADRLDFATAGFYDVLPL